MCSCFDKTCAQQRKSVRYSVANTARALTQTSPSGVQLAWLIFCCEARRPLPASVHYARPTGQGPMGLTQENGTFFGQIWATERKGPYHFLFDHKSENLLKGNKLICQNGMANIDLTGQTDQSGPEYSGRTEQK